MADAYMHAWNSRDVDAILALHSDTSTFQVHGRTPVIEGIDALRKAFHGVFELYPNFHGEARRLLLGPEHWLLDWTLHFTLNGSDPREFHCIDIVEVSPEGLVTRKDTFYDYPQAQAAMAGATS
ncbi:nuclear transport factor 2 family protein [Kribbella sancticallisti]|uniref:nuclear transport factor 2 family protein n=1 Tax=Kribbella sancticallisti TaxID=460087 RepID=UPI0031E309D9